MIYEEQSQIIITNKNSIEDNLDFITKEYKDIRLKPNKLYNKKFKYNNSEQFNKELAIISFDDIIKIKTEKIFLDLLSKN